MSFNFRAFQLRVQPGA